MPTFILALSPSVNSLYANVRGKGRVKSARYRSWIHGELLALTAQRARPVAPPVSITITLPETTRGDASNRIKAAEDILVRAGIIPNDDKKTVRAISVSFAKSDMMRVSVEPYVEAAA